MDAAQPLPLPPGLLRTNDVKWLSQLIPPDGPERGGRAAGGLKAQAPLMCCWTLLGLDSSTENRAWDALNLRLIGSGLLPPSSPEHMGFGAFPRPGA